MRILNMILGCIGLLLGSLIILTGAACAIGGVRGNDFVTILAGALIVALGYWGFKAGWSMITGREEEIGDPDRYPCPHCGESIPTAAKVCRFCGEEFTSAENLEPPQPRSRRK